MINDSLLHRRAAASRNIPHDSRPSGGGGQGDTRPPPPAPPRRIVVIHRSTTRTTSVGDRDAPGRWLVPGGATAGRLSVSHHPMARTAAPANDSRPWAAASRAGARSEPPHHRAPPSPAPRTRTTAEAIVPEAGTVLPDRHAIGPRGNTTRRGSRPRPPRASPSPDANPPRRRRSGQEVPNSRRSSRAISAGYRLGASRTSRSAILASAPTRTRGRPSSTPSTMTRAARSAGIRNSLSL